MTTGEQSMENNHRVSIGITYDSWDFGSFVVDSYRANALGHGHTGYPIHRHLRFSARRELQAVFDDLGLSLGWRAHRISGTRIVLETEGLLISGEGTRKPDYCSCTFDIWANHSRQAEVARAAILARVDEALIRDPIISIDWNFLSGKGELHSRHIEEIADDVLYDEAYPDLRGGVANFVTSYLDAAETVLVLQGPPGTGKTRLIRGILGELSRRRGGNAEVLYTGDKKALETDEIFVKFLTRDCDAFVVEDADHVLQPRAKGNDHLHRFLTIADGIVRAQGRKIIFSTNLPNVGDLDDALVRPGRCFARLSTRRLAANEACALYAALVATCEKGPHQEFEPAGFDAGKAYSLADVFKRTRADCTRRLNDASLNCFRAMTLEHGG